MDGKAKDRVREVGVATYKTGKGLVIPRRFTKKGEDPFAGIEFDLRNSIIKNTHSSIFY